MSFDCNQIERNKGERRVYVCECGDVRVETKHSRRSFAPAEFVALLREILARKKTTNTRRLPISSAGKNFFKLILLALCAVVFGSCAARTATENGAEKIERIVTVGGSVTEIVYALGAGERVVVPHLLRLTTGADHRFLLKNSALLGAALILGADVLARSVVAPAELPIGIVTAFVGTPFFVWLLLRKQA